MMIRKKKAQSALEYLILIGSLILVLVLLLSPQGIMRDTIDDRIGEAVDQISTMTESTFGTKAGVIDANIDIELPNEFDDGYDDGWHVTQ